MGKTDNPRNAEKQGASERVPQPAEKSEAERGKEAMHELDELRREEAALLHQSFALDVFYEHGGQLLLEEFGAKKVFDALKKLHAQARSDRRGLPDMYDLVVALEGDADKRASLLSVLEKRSLDAMEEYGAWVKDQRGPRPAHHENSNWSSISMQHIVMRLLRQRDMPIIGKILNDRDIAIDRGVENLQVYFFEPEKTKELTDLMARQENPNDVLAAAKELYEQSRVLNDERRELMDKQTPAIREKIQEITAKAWADYGNAVLNMLESYGHLDEMDGSNPFNVRVKEEVVKTITKEIDALERETLDRIERETAAHKKLLAELESMGTRSAF